MHPCLHYFLLLSLCFSAQSTELMYVSSGALQTEQAVASSKASANHQDHNQHSEQYQHDHSAQHPPATANIEKAAVMSHAHDCCDEGETKQQVQCCASECSGCQHDCGSSAPALISTVSNVSLFLTNSLRFYSKRFPDSPHKPSLIPPIT